jgi:hypothetical protein
VTPFAQSAAKKAIDVIGPALRGLLATGENLKIVLV